jgi:hypothetical protein
MARRAALACVLAISASSVACDRLTNRGRPPKGATLPSLSVTLSPASATFTITTDGVARTVGAGCTLEAGAGPTLSWPRGAMNAPAVSACARSLRAQPATRLAKTDYVVVDGTNDAPYEDVLSLVDALRRDDAGEMFTSYSVKHRPPKHPPPPSTPAPEQQRTANNDQQGVALIVSGTKVLVDDDAVLEIASASASASGPGDLATRGLPDPEKPADDDALPTVARALTKWRTAARERHAVDDELILILEPQTPFLVLRELMTTADSAGFTRYHLMILRRAK